MYRGRVTKLADARACVQPGQLLSREIARVGRFLRGDWQERERERERERATATFDAPDEIRRNRLGIIKVPWRMRRDAASALVSIGNFTGRERGAQRLP